MPTSSVGSGHLPARQAKAREGQCKVAADQQGQAGQQKRRDMRQLDTQRRQGPPQGDGGERQQIGFHTKLRHRWTPAYDPSRP
jgi:hypothetical protein